MGNLSYTKANTELGFDASVHLYITTTIFALRYKLIAEDIIA